MRLFTAALIALLVLLQYSLWFGKNSLHDYFDVERQVEELEARNQELAQRNRVLIAEISDLRNGNAAIEERARNELGMIKEGETFYRLIPTAKENDE
jgi:cell division protein FtsB